MDIVQTLKVFFLLPSLVHKRSLVSVFEVLQAAPGSRLYLPENPFRQTKLLHESWKRKSGTQNHSHTVSKENDTYGDIEWFQFNLQESRRLRFSESHFAEQPRALLKRPGFKDQAQGVQDKAMSNWKLPQREQTKTMQVRMFWFYWKGDLTSLENTQFIQWGVMNRLAG